MNYSRIGGIPVVILSCLLALFTPAHAQGESAASAQEWQKACVNKNLYEREERREVVAKYGLAILIPRGFDFDYNAYDFGDGYNSERISIAPIDELVHIRCMRMGAQLHGMRIHGSGVPGYTIYEKSQGIGDVSRDRFVDAIVIFGSKRPVYYNGYSFWVSFVNPANKKTIFLEGADVSERQFMDFAKSIILIR